MKRFAAGVFTLLVMLVAPAAAGAVEINVNTTSDEYGGGTSCSLREAITAAQTDSPYGGCSAGSGADTILIPGGQYRLTRAGAEEDANSTGDLDITGPDNLEIRPAAPNARVTVDANEIDRVFDKSGAGETRIESIRIRGGKLTEIEDGGGIRVNGGGVFAEYVTIDGNESAYQGGGAAVYSAMHLTNSTISGNRAGGSGGGFYAAGGSLVNAKSTTITGNQADADGNGNGVGGGFAEVGVISVGFTNVINAGNTSAPPVGDARNNDCSSGPFFYPRHSLQSQLFGPADCLIAFDPGTNRVSMESQVGPLGYHGGQTPTHNLRPGAVAIGTGGTTPPDTCPPIDQNGVGRPAGSCDIGSVQFVPKPVLKINRLLPKKKVVKRGKARVITVVVKNTGTGPASGVKVCLQLKKAAKKGLKIRGKACKSPGKLAIGAVKRAKIRLVAKAKAKRKAYPVRATVRGKELAVKGKGFKVRVR